MGTTSENLVETNEFAGKRVLVTGGSEYVIDGGTIPTV